jgi:hypothetical protein
MAQFDFGTIDPNTTSGTDLASDLNDWRDALHSLHVGTSAPSYVVQGLLWADSTDGNNWSVYQRSSSGVDVPIYKIDTANGQQARQLLDQDEDSYLIMGKAADDALSFYFSDTEEARWTGTGLRFGAGAATVTLDMQDSTDGARMPSGTTAQRPTGANGLIRFNSTINRYEGFNGSAWYEIGRPDVQFTVDQVGTTALDGERGVSTITDVAVGTTQINTDLTYANVNAMIPVATNSTQTAVTNSMLCSINTNSTTQIAVNSCEVDGSPNDLTDGRFHGSMTTTGGT